MIKIKYFLILLFFAFMENSQAQESFSFSADHIALQVMDLERSANFYENILGLEETYNAGLGKNFKWYKLKNGFQIHLIKSDQSIEKYKSVHFAIKTKNLDVVMKHLRENNIPFENWSGEKNTTNTRPDGILQIYLKDPDGYWIEINNNG